jgi:hypothetical protein
MLGDVLVQLAQRYWSSDPSMVRDWCETRYGPHLNMLRDVSFKVQLRRMTCRPTHVKRLLLIWVDKERIRTLMSCVMLERVGGNRICGCE